MQDSNTSVLLKIAELIEVLPKDWAVYAAAELGVKEQTARSYSRGDRYKSGQPLLLLKALTKYQNSISKEVQKLTA